MAQVTQKRDMRMKMRDRRQDFDSIIYPGLRSPRMDRNCVGSRPDADEGRRQSIRCDGLAYPASGTDGLQSTS